MRARVNKQQAREGLLQALSCRPGAECAKPIIAELIDAGIIRGTAARNYAIRHEFKLSLAKPGAGHDDAIRVVAATYELDVITVRQIVRGVRGK